MTTSIQIPTVVSATFTHLGNFTVDYDEKASEQSIGVRFTDMFSKSGRTMARGFHPEDQGVKQVELATLRLSLDTELSRETLAEVVTNIDKAHPWRFAGIRALLTLGFGDTYREDVNLIAFASRCHIPSDSDMGYPILNPSKRRLGIGWRAQDQVVLMVREAATS